MMIGICVYGNIICGYIMYNYSDDSSDSQYSSKKSKKEIKSKMKESKNKFFIE